MKIVIENRYINTDAISAANYIPSTEDRDSKLIVWCPGDVEPLEYTGKAADYIWQIICGDSLVGDKQ